MRRRCTGQALWNTLLEDCLGCHCLLENSHVHDVELVAVKMKWVCQRIVDVYENELNY